MSPFFTVFAKLRNPLNKHFGKKLEKGDRSSLSIPFNSSCAHTHSSTTHPCSETRVQHIHEHSRTHTHDNASIHLVVILKPSHLLHSNTPHTCADMFILTRFCAHTRIILTLLCTHTHTRAVLHSSHDDLTRSLSQISFWFGAKG